MCRLWYWTFGHCCRCYCCCSFFCYLALFGEYSNFPNCKCFLYWSTLVCCCEAPIILIAIICSFVRSLTREMGTDRLINCCEINSWCPNEWTHLIVLNVRQKNSGNTTSNTYTHPTPSTTQFCRNLSVVRYLMSLKIASRSVCYARTRPGKFGIEHEFG